MPGNGKKYPVVVMGIGNILWADEGFGVRAVEEFHKAWNVPEGVTVLDGGTLGYFLSEYIEESSRLIIFDCCDFRAEPGTFSILTKDDINPWLATKMSAHQDGLTDLFAMAKIRRRYPDEIVVLGCQPADLEDYGGSLTPKVQAAVPAAVEAAAKQLEAWGYAPARRPEGEKVEPLAESCLEQDVYEAGRPSEAAACRFADPRFLPHGEKSGKEEA